MLLALGLQRSLGLRQHMILGFQLRALVLQPHAQRLHFRLLVRSTCGQLGLRLAQRLQPKAKFLALGLQHGLGLRQRLQLAFHFQAPLRLPTQLGRCLLQLTAQCLHFRLLVLSTRGQLDLGLTQHLALCFQRGVGRRQSLKLAFEFHLAAFEDRRALLQLDLQRLHLGLLVPYT